MNRIFGLDLMRALAILFVLLAHARAFWTTQYPAVEALSLFGYMGVEVFFVLSGFLIGGILIRGHEKGIGIREFWARRWYRTLPNYYLFLAINLALGATLLELPAGNLSYWLFGQNLFYEMPYFFPESWSLTVEEWFYLLTPLLIYGLARLMGNLRQAVLATVIAVTVLTLGMRILTVLMHAPAWDAGVRKITLLRLDSLMFGILGAWLAHYRKSLWARLKGGGVVIGALLTLLACALYYSFDKNHSFFARTFYFGLTSFAFFWFLPALSAWRAHGNRAVSAIVTRLSIWSYSLYLCHYAILLLFLQKIPAEMREAPWTAALATFLWLSFSLIVSMVTFRFYEAPMTALRDRRRVKAVARAESQGSC